VGHFAFMTCCPPASTPTPPRRHASRLINDPGHQDAVRHQQRSFRPAATEASLICATGCTRAGVMV